ncbi:MAG TPA: hypothetical protein VGX02_03090 [Candidatus Eremiobacteraceae bacterium]|nr:hypothetical protein [Candidatus Eremiobacteraceae bacterium]
MPTHKVVPGLCSGRIYSTAFALALALLACTSSATAAGFPSGATLGAQPDLTVGPNPPDGPGYVIASHCSPDEPLISFLLRVTNIGSINSQPIPEDKAVTVSDTTDIWWTAGAPLGTIGAGQAQAVRIDLPGRPGVSGKHEFLVSVNAKPWFDEYSFDNNKLTLTLTIPAGLCPKK